MSNMENIYIVYVVFFIYNFLYSKKIISCSLMVKYIIQLIYVDEIILLGLSIYVKYQSNNIEILCLEIELEKVQNYSYKNFKLW